MDISNMDRDVSSSYEDRQDTTDFRGQSSPGSRSSARDSSEVVVSAWHCLLESYSWSRWSDEIRGNEQEEDDGCGLFGKAGARRLDRIFFSLRISDQLHDKLS